MGRRRFRRGGREGEEENWRKGRERRGEEGIGIMEKSNTRRRELKEGREEEEEKRKMEDERGAEEIMRGGDGGEEGRGKKGGIGRGRGGGKEGEF